LAVHIALEKIGAEFQLNKVDVRKGEHQAKEFLQLNKRGKVPLLLDGDKHIDQGAAILLYLADKHPEAELMPKIDDSARGEALSALLYMSNTVHPTLAMCFFPDRYSNGDSKAVLFRAIDKTKLLMQELNESLEGKQYLCGEMPFAPDYYLMTMLNWLQIFSIALDVYPNLLGFKHRIEKLPEVGSAVGKEMTAF
jgi:glutathione S-transferase